MPKPLTFNRLALARFSLAAALALVALLGGSVDLRSAPAAENSSVAPATAVPAIKPSAAQPKPQAAPAAQSLQPTDRHRSIARRVYENLDRFHYSRQPLDDALSAKIFDLYIEALDGSRSFLLASDLAELQKLRLKMDDAVKSGALEPAFRIFSRFQLRNRERLTQAMELLGQEPDFTRDEWFAFDREQSPWITTPAQMNELWRKRVKNDAVSLMLTGKTWPETRDILRKRYERALKRFEQISADDVFNTFMNAYARAYDPHSTYFSPRDSEEYRIQMSLSYEGIGASLQMIEDYVTVQSVLPGGPAAASGQLSENDRITGVGQGAQGPVTDVIGWRLEDVVQLIRGPLGSVVRLQVLPAGAAPGTADKMLKFTRNKVVLESQAAQKEVREVTRNGRTLKIGVINVPSFYQDVTAENAGEENYRSTTRDVRRLIEELKTEKVDGLILDLRGNGGGYLPEATALTGLFIDKGPIVQLKDSTGKLEVLDDPESGAVYGGPLAVLVDRLSASASEIFAGAIQDYGRGLIIGQQTYGKGTVQNLIPLDRFALGPNPAFGQLTVTIGKFYRVSGDSTQNHGITPDILLPSLISTEEVGENTRENALPWDRIASVSYRADRQLQTAVQGLEHTHDSRAAGEPDFRLLVSDVAAFDQLRQQKSVSLNLKARQAERAKLEEDRLQRENARRAAHGLKPLAKLEDAKEDSKLDAALNETSQIVADMVALPALVRVNQRSSTL